MIIGVISYFEFFQNTETIPPRILFVIVPSIIYVIYFYNKLVVENLKISYLLSIHILRLPVEISLYQLFLREKIPIIMTYKGWNFDIIFSISAITLLLFMATTKREFNNYFFRVWNSIGLMFLIIIVITALLSAPSTFQQLAFEQPNIAVLEFPYTLLPAIIVPTVLLSHLLCLKRNKF